MIRIDKCLHNTTWQGLRHYREDLSKSYAEAILFGLIKTKHCKFEPLPARY